MIESQTHDGAGEVCGCIERERGQDDGEVGAEDRLVAVKGD